MKPIVLRLSVLAVLSATTPGQSSCFEPAALVSTGARPHTAVLADIDGDGDPDALLPSAVPGLVAIHRQNGDGVFAAPETYPLLGVESSLAVTDLEGDGDVDFVVRAGSLRKFVNDGTGAFTMLTVALVVPTQGEIAAGDLDGDGDADLVTVIDDFGFRLLSVLFQGPGGAFTTFSFSTWTGGMSALALGDIDGDGDLDLLAQLVDWEELRVYRNNGAGVFTLIESRATNFNTADIVLADFDGDADLDVATVGGFLGASHVARLRNSGGGAFVGLADIPIPMDGGKLAVGDFDGDHDLDLAVDGFVTGTGYRIKILENSGAFSFVAGPVLTAVGIGLGSADLDGDGDADLLAVSNSAPTFLAIRNCTRSGVPICAGDGSGTACPCGNSSAPGSGAGCRNSFGLDARLRGQGSATLGSDGLALTLDGAPATASALYFQGTQAESGGAGVVFGDGLRCAGGTVARLGTKTCVGGSATYPQLGDAPIGASGPLVPGDERIYQVWYRNLASFCTPAGFNLTNGLRIVWGA